MATSHGLIILNRPERLRARALSLVPVIGFPGRLPFNTKKEDAALRLRPLPFIGIN